MDVKPKKPEPKQFAKLKDLDTAVAKSKDTPADTKALETARKDIDTATAALASAMDKQHKAFTKAFQRFPDVTKSPAPAGPVPIPYPVFGKLEKEIKDSSKRVASALKKQEQAQKKLVKVIDQQIKVLKPMAKSSHSAEASTMKGLIDAKSAGKSQWVACCTTVKLEGKRITRFLDLAAQHSDKNN